MKIEIISVGQTPPSWVTQGCADYQKRLPKEYHLTLTEIPLGKRNKTGDAYQARAQEAQAVLTKIPAASYVVALHIAGNAWTTAELAENLSKWRTQQQHVALLIGGPDGLDQSLLVRANAQWSLSKLTFPHMLVRLILIEQLYRAHCILTGHPYHRA